MSNSYFRFKQFRIDQDRCAMKVTTDACLQGAWTPIQQNVKRVLDIGTGTGLLSLMLAQRAPDVIIDAIELDADAAEQAAENVAASPWGDRIQVLQGDARTYPFAHKYDLIICNPPFFNNSLLSGNESKDRARHSISLTQMDLLTIAKKLLTDNGYLSVLFPYAEYMEWWKLVYDEYWHELYRMPIFNHPLSGAGRVVSVVGLKNYGEVRERGLVIRATDGKYADEFKELLADYYLDLPEKG